MSFDAVYVLYIFPSFRYSLVHYFTGVFSFCTDRYSRTTKIVQKPALLVDRGG